MRLKIILGNLVVVLLVGVIAFAVVRTQLATGLVSGLSETVSGDSVLLARSWLLSGRVFKDHVDEQAKHQRVREIFAGLDSGSRRSRAHDMSNKIARWFADPARGGRGAPDLVAITDETGATVARNLDPNRTVRLRQLDAVREVLADGVTRLDVWIEPEEKKVLQVAVARIESEEGSTLGTLVVGNVLSDGFASAEGKLLSRDVAFVTADSVVASSLARSLRDQLDQSLREDHRTQVEAALRPDGSRSEIRLTVGGADWLGVVAPLPQANSVPVAAIVLVNETDATQLTSVANIILMTTLLGMLFVSVYGAIIGNSLTKPLETIEDGVLAVINGQTDLRLDIDSPEFGGLAYRINQLINVFTGVEEEDVEGRLSVRPPGANNNVWGPEEASDAQPSAPRAAGAGQAPEASAEDGELAARLAAEPETAYYDRIFDEYVKAKTALGESVANIPKERFIERLKKNARAQIAKHGSRDVRFQVETEGNQVKLRPVVIR